MTVSDNTTEAVVGFAFIVATIAFLAFLLNDNQVFETGDQYEISASFGSAEGVSVGTDVRIAGVKVGAVSAMQLDFETYRADVEMSLRSDITIPEDSLVAISSEGLLGGNFVEIFPGGSFDTVEPGGQLELTQGPLSLIDLLSKFVSS